MKKLFTLILLLFFTFITVIAQQKEANPAAQGFNANASDAKAIQIADEVMQAMGGRQNWDDTHYIVWNFFGRRKLIWDKYTGDVRIESGKDIYLVNINNNSGQIKMGEEILTNPDSIKKYVERGVGTWINDSYWLLMPFKLKDSGVTLKYLGEQTPPEGKPADVLQMTFENVGRTPDNKYRVYVDKESRLVSHWEYFQKYTDEKPSISSPWTNYQQYGKIILSSDRGPNRQLSQIAVYSEIPKSVFTSFEAVDYSRFK
ncbi:MAG: hypothetical protein SFU99_21530 [Saprospiraceae bacterium]|nr:hypothetical protein [Saprospiraceae bacterium]